MAAFARFFSLLMVCGGQAIAAPLTIGQAIGQPWGEALVREWAWALRGGGADFVQLSLSDLASPDSKIPLIIIDSVPLNRAALQGIENWVSKGGTLLYAGAESALQERRDNGEIRIRNELVASELFGARFAGQDPGLVGSYPDFVQSSPLVSPLIAGDALRFGLAGLDDTVSVEASTATVIARSARLSPGSGDMVLKSSSPTILSNRYGKGRVLFLTFSPGHIAACYPPIGSAHAALDCNAAGSAHALIRWLTANLLWEEHGLQIPLLWEAPGERPHAFIVTGDVHGKLEYRSALKVGKLIDSLHVPLSFYLLGFGGKESPAELQGLRQLNNLELSTHSSENRGYTVKKFKWTGSSGIYLDLRKAEAMLGLPHFPSDRKWLNSMRNHSWASDDGAWQAMHRGGIGLVFDENADALQQRFPYKAPTAWYTGNERRRLFFPLYEHNVASSTDNFRLPENLERDMAILASAQAEPCCVPITWRTYGDYVLRWHALFDRLATVGGLTEVWLWHPHSVIEKEGGVAEVERMLQSIRSEATVSMVRGDVAAGWRANRERYPIHIERDSAGAIQVIDLSPPIDPPLPLPPGSPDFAATTSYWVIGPLSAKGWSSRNWIDPAGRTITVLVHPLPKVPQ